VYTDLTETIRSFIEETFLVREKGEALADTDSLLGQGIIDSAGVLSLVIFLEETFSIQVLDEEVIPANLDSITNLVAFIQGKLADRAVPA
jgi:acyl carrier protein